MSENDRVVLQDSVVVNSENRNTKFFCPFKSNDFTERTARDGLTLGNLLHYFDSAFSAVVAEAQSGLTTSPIPVDYVEPDIDSYVLGELDFDDIVYGPKGNLDD